MKRLGLLGKNISHSQSQKMYEEILGEKVNYTLFDFDSDEKIPTLSDFFKEIEGLSITTPYKKHFLNKVTCEESIKKLNAINCIKKKQSIFYATNTDFTAIIEILNSHEFNQEEKCKYVILGDGVMSQVVQEAFLKLEITDFEVISRKTHGALEKFVIPKEKCQLIVINACSRQFVFSGSIQKDAIFWDLNYDYEPHFYLKERLNKYIDGTSLLKIQARHALDFWKVID